MSETRRSTLHDVARQCGVSYQTVSRVINNHPYVAEDTRQRVLTAIETLRYRPNRAAQTLAGNHTHVLGMLTLGIENYGPAQVMIHTEQAARAAGYDLIFAHSPDSSLEHMRATLSRLLHWQIDGLIFITPIAGMAREDLRALSGSYPTVQIGTAHSGITMSVGVDQYQGGVMAAAHLLSLGHRRIVELAGPVDWIDASERHTGFESHLNQHNCSPVVTMFGDWSARSGYESVNQLIQSNVDFTAVFSANDQMAIGVLRALQEHGWRVPEDVSVIGFDDIPEAAYLSPPLTTVRQDFSALGVHGVQYLLDLIRDPESEAAQILIAPQLIERKSTASPRTD